MGSGDSQVGFSELSFDCADRFDCNLYMWACWRFLRRGRDGCSNRLLFSAVSLGLNIYLRGAKLSEDAESHARCADCLWAVKEDYLSLLTDFEDLDIDAIRERRGVLQRKVAEIYSKAPRTDNRAYEAASARLKNGYQTFELEECDKFLPPELRGRY